MYWVCSTFSFIFWRFIMSLISLHNVSYQYPLTNEFVLKDVNIEIDQGKIYGIIGPNQSGKTTLCNILRGFIPSIFMGNLSGEVLFQGKPLKDKNIGELAEYIGYSSQNPFTQISGVKDSRARGRRGRHLSDPERASGILSEDAGRRS